MMIIVCASNSHSEILTFPHFDKVQSVVFLFGAFAIFGRFAAAMMYYWLALTICG